MSERESLIASSGRANSYGNANTGGRIDTAVVQVPSTPAAATITFHSLWYSVRVRRGPPCCFSQEKLDILRGVSGIFRPGMNAVMGPTGSGKSTLLDVIAGRKDPRHLTGTILINGELPPKDFKCASGYVVQDDVVMGTLTVRENLAFSAALRLPESVSRSIRGRRVAQLLDELGLAGVADRRVGSELMRGVSGGERRRTSIGMELVVSPQVLFLDEPTTGLDASTANIVMAMLRNISRQGTTIIFSIHQPRYAIFKTFDSLMLLSKGETVYHGSSTASQEYFQGLGYVCEMHNNPLDFYMDIMNGDVTPTSVDAGDSQSSVQSRLVAAYLDSDTWRQVGAEIEPALESFHKRQIRGNRQSLVTKSATVGYQTSFIRQLFTVSHRAIINLVRSPQAMVAQLGMNLVFGLLVGMIFLQIPADTVSGVQNRVGVFFFVTMNVVFGNMGALEIFLRERVIFAHECVSGYYRVSVYFLAKVFCDLIPLRLVPLLLFSPIAYFMVGLVPRVDKFFIFFLNLFMVSMSGSGLAFFISASVSNFSVASVFLALPFIFMTVFGGLLVNVDTMGAWLSWAKYVSIFRYSMNALGINEMKDLQFCNKTADICFELGNKYLRDQGIEYESDIDLWVNEIALGVSVVVFLTLAYMRLQTMSKYT